MKIDRNVKYRRTWSTSRYHSIILHWTFPFHFNSTLSSAIDLGDLVGTQITWREDIWGVSHKEKKSIVLTILSRILRNYYRRQIIEIRYRQSQEKMLHAQLADARSAECHCTSAISDHFRKALWTFLQSAGNRAIFVISSEHVSLIPSTNR